MLAANDLCDMIRKGGILRDVEGNTVEEVYAAVSARIFLPSGLTAETVRNALLSREKILSTAVGNGIAIPHPRKTLLKDDRDQRMAVCFLKHPLAMGSPDNTKVFVLFVLLTAKSKYHFEVLSTIASLIRIKNFRDFLKTSPDEMQLLDAIKNTKIS